MEEIISGRKARGATRKITVEVEVLQGDEAIILLRDCPEKVMENHGLSRL
jgi:hypothetical protein